MEEGIAFGKQLDTLLNSTGVQNAISASQATVQQTSQLEDALILLPRIIDVVEGMTRKEYVHQLPLARLKVCLEAYY
jgi:hypothetical protein